MKPLLYVDGYNVIGVWPQAQRENWPLDVCRDRLIHLLEDYAGYSGQEIWLVFDGYRTGRALRTVEERDGLTVVYTRHRRNRRSLHRAPMRGNAQVPGSPGGHQRQRGANGHSGPGRYPHQLPGAMVGVEPDPQPGTGPAPARPFRRRVYHRPQPCPGSNTSFWTRSAGEKNKGNTALFGSGADGAFSAA